MDISISQEQGNAPVTVLKLSGQLDGQTYQGLIMKAQQVIGEGATNILLDMSDLTYISSAGLVSLHTIALLLKGETPPDPEQGWSALKSMGDSSGGSMHKNIKRKSSACWTWSASRCSSISSTTNKKRSNPSKR
jgi:ABC-type transporter Mla MlaB component